MATIPAHQSVAYMTLWVISSVSVRWRSAASWSSLASRTQWGVVSEYKMALSLRWIPAIDLWICQNLRKGKDSRHKYVHHSTYRLELHRFWLKSCRVSIAGYPSNGNHNLRTTYTDCVEHWSDTDTSFMNNWVLKWSRSENSFPSGPQRIQIGLVRLGLEQNSFD